MTPTKEASTFYAMMALLKVANHYGQFLIDSKEVAFSLKRDMKLLMNRINDLDKKCQNSLDGSDADLWSRQWNERDYEVFSSVLFQMCDMTDEAREVAEQFMGELAKGNVKVQAA